jgi:2-oxoisovalerate dehydrogenase E1 component
MPKRESLTEELQDRALDPVNIYRHLYLPRAIENKMLRMIRHNRISKWFSAFGQEAIAVGSVLALRDSDWMLPTHRNLGTWTTRGVPLEPLFCQLMGRAGGYTQGRDRSFHFGLLDSRLVGMISHMAAMLPVACGFALAAQYKGLDDIVLVFCGDGASREGDFHEAVNLAAVWHLPVLFVVENNGYALSTPSREEFVVEDLADAAAGYGIEGVVVDGNDIFAVIREVGRAAARARSGEGPSLLEMKTFRMRGHEEASGTKYVPEDLIAKWAELDPIQRLRNQLLADEVIDEEGLAALEKELDREVDSAAEYAVEQPVQITTLETETASVFASNPAASNPASNPAVDETSSAPAEETEMRFIDAVSEGLRVAMERDDSVVLLGQDVAEYGGAFKVTAGFMDQFGRERVRNTPIVESAAVGAGMGMALAGLKPIIEIQYADFITCGFNQIVNNLATTHYRWGEGLNVVIRAPFGGGIGAGPFHSQSPEAWFCHVPGLKVVIPGTPRDAKGLLLAALEDPNPVLVFEHKYLYRSMRGQVPEGHYTIPIGKAHVPRVGSDLTILTYGVGTTWALEEAERQESSGRSIEVVDLRTLVPLDRDTIMRSVSKTNRVVVLHEAPMTAGFGAELTALVAQEAFHDLDAPPFRVGGADTPIPFSANIERDVYSARGRLAEAIESVLAF